MSPKKPRGLRAVIQAFNEGNKHVQIPGKEISRLLLFSNDKDVHEGDWLGCLDNVARYPS